MKRLRIYGCSNNQKLKKEVRDASTFFIEKLIPRKRIYDISVNCVDGLIEKSGSFGECWNWSRNSFSIRFDINQNKENRLKTLAHEFVHVKQFALGELKFLSRFDIWQDKVYYHDAKYELTPWEKEATRYETILYNRYMKVFSNKIL